MIEKRTGVAIPVFSLRSRESFGIGEFEDLKLLVDWCVKTGQNIIQILPINDTTFFHTWQDSYPYNACSSFALHPQFLRLTLMGVEADSRYCVLRDGLNSLPALDYERVNEAKMELLWQHFRSSGQNDCRRKAYKSFVEENAEWLLPYAAYCHERDHKAYSERFYCYLQYHLDLQLTSVVEYARSKGVVLKGDLPIGVSATSCDVKQFPKLFNLDFSAGAPPDFFSQDGQNWGFPTYNWEEMAKDGYLWWRRRLGRMSRYFNAFRIDHILGFFRIWEIPRSAKSGLLGHFNPAMPLSPEEMQEQFGFSFSKKFLKPSCSVPSDVLFVEDPRQKGLYHPRIMGSGSSWYASLPDDQKDAFNRLHDDFFFHRHNEFWKESAMKKLPALVGCTDMVACGEDLGMVPACVPEVMKSLGILSLAIQRMHPDMNVEFGDPKCNPEMSVCTTSTHDMSPIRAWWEEDREGASTRYYYNYLHWEGPVPYFCEDWLVRGILQDHFKSPSVYKIFPLQDYLALCPRLRRTMPQEEQVNHPENPRHYWRYRMHIMLEDLLNADDLNGDIIKLIQK